MPSPEKTMPRPLNQTDTDLNADNLLRLPAEFGCPVWVYDAQIIREKIAALHQFDVVRFAQKACSNIHILRLMREQGVKVDSVSLGKSNARWRPDTIRSRQRCHCLYGRPD
jgi:diaminopimelate decarboxylase